jgi:F0F1-type ATP synthase assembly protein I
LDDKPNDTKSTSPETQKARKDSTQWALAVDLPVTFGAAVILGGALGYYLDKWLRTSPWLMIVLGALGFVGGIVEIARRLGPKDSGGNDVNLPS